MILDPAGAPLADVEITVLGHATKARTAADGAFRLAELPAGSTIVLVRRVGYTEGSFVADLRAGDTTLVSFAMSPTSQRLGTVAVMADSAPISARLAAFEARRRTGGGTYITREEIVRRVPVEVGDLLRQIKSLRLADSSGVRLAISRRSLKLDRRTFQPVPCVMSVAVNGMRLPAGSTVNQMAPEEIAGIEVYAGPATIPREFSQSGPDAFCGLIAIWTRDR